MTQQRTSTLKRIIELNDIRQHNQLVFDMRATTDECQTLAKRFGLLEVKELNAYVTLSRGAGADLFKVEGELSAAVVQECCVTLAPVDEHISESYSEVLTTVAAALPREEDTDGDADQPVDLIEGETLDVGEIVAQWLGLALNPYPRSDAPVFQYLETDSPAEDKQTPFKVLEALTQGA